MSGKFVNSIIHGSLQQPHGLGVNKDGNLIISCWSSQTIALFSTVAIICNTFSGMDRVMESLMVPLAQPFTRKTKTRLCVTRITTEWKFSIPFSIS